MNRLSDFLQAVCEEIRQNCLEPEERAVVRYPNMPKGSPLRRTVTAVGIERAEFKSLAVGEREKREALLTLGFKVCVPFSESAPKCFDVMQRIFEYLIFDSALRVGACAPKAVSANERTGAFELDGTAEVGAELFKGADTNAAQE